jgi:hypothetical protein
VSTPQVSSVSSMFDIADQFLQATVAAMTTTPAGPPARATVVLGDPVFDDSCGQAFVSVPALTEGSTNPGTPPEATGRRISRGRVNLVAMTAWAIRCVHVTSGLQQGFVPPSDAELAADALQGYEDGWAVWNYITRAVLNDTLFSGPCGIVHFDGGQAVTPSGGLGGWKFTIRVELPGYDPT